MNTTITREQFAHSFNKVFYNSWDKLFDKILEGFKTTNFKCFWFDETVYIVDLLNEELITWYKLAHIGRALKITKDDATIEYIEDMFKEFKEELKLP